MELLIEGLIVPHFSAWHSTRTITIPCILRARTFDDHLSLCTDVEAHPCGSKMMFS